MCLYVYVLTNQGWIQGQRHAEKTSKEALCLGLQWKVSSSPMLPSGLFWTSDHCSRFGGYVCKRRNQDNLDQHFENQTIISSEGFGTLTSPSECVLQNHLKFKVNAFIFEPIK